VGAQLYRADALGLRPEYGLERTAISVTRVPRHVWRGISERLFDLNDLLDTLAFSCGATDPGGAIDLTGRTPGDSSGRLHRELNVHRCVRELDAPFIVFPQYACLQQHMNIGVHGPHVAAYPSRGLA
jgi:hypothetical protein